jgi:hypothetical protein
MRRPHDLGPDLKNPVHELNSLDVGHGRQHRASKALETESWWGKVITV